MRSKKTYWIIEKHGLFQTYYTAEHLDGDKNAREKYKDHKYYQATIDFCENYDQSSFDPNYKSMSLEEFKPMVKNILYNMIYGVWVFHFIYYFRQNYSSLSVKLI